MIVHFKYVYWCDQYEVPLKDDFILALHCWGWQININWLINIGVHLMAWGKPQAFGMAPKTSNGAMSGNGMHNFWNVHVDWFGAVCRPNIIAYW